MPNPLYIALAGLLISLGVFLICRAFYRLEQELADAKKRLRDLGETGEISDEEWRRVLTETKLV